MRTQTVAILFAVVMLLAMGGFLIAKGGWPGIGRGVTIIFSLLAGVLALVWFVQGTRHMIGERKNEIHGQKHDEK